MGRWLSIDPFWAKYPGLTAYNFGKCSPILYFDDDGRDVIEGAMYVGYSKKRNAYLFERSYYNFTRSKTAQQFIRNFSNGHDSKLSVIRNSDKQPGKWAHHTVEFVPSKMVEYGTPRGWTNVAIMTKDGTFKYLSDVSEEDLKGIPSSQLQIKIELNVQTADIKTAEGGQIIAHEAFVHGKKFIEEAEKIRSEKNVSPAEILKRINQVNSDGRTSKDSGHHKQFKYGKNKNYENWMKDIAGSKDISNAEKSEIKESITNDKDNQ